MSDINTHEPAAAEPEGSFFSRMAWLFVAPVRLFDDIAAGTPWWEPWVWVSVLNMVASYLSAPVKIHLTRLNPRGLPEEQIQQTIAAFERPLVKVSSLLSEPVSALIVALVVAGISYVVLTLQTDRARFKKYFSLYLYGSILISVETVISVVVIRIRGVETVQSLEDLVLSFGIESFFPFHKLLTPVLASLGVFAVWFYVIVGIGVTRVFGLPGRSAFLVVIPVWLLFVLYGLVNMQLLGIG